MAFGSVNEFRRALKNLVDRTARSNGRRSGGRKKSRSRANPRYDIPLSYPIEDFTYGPAPRLAHRTSDITYGHKQFYRANNNGGARPLRIGYGTYNVFQRYWHGQWDPLYAVLSRRGGSTDWVTVHASPEEHARLVEVAEEIISSSPDANEVRTARAALKLFGESARSNSGEKKWTKPRLRVIEGGQPRKSKSNPQTDCPTCGAPAGYGCITRNGNPTSTHAMRNPGRGRPARKARRNSCGFSGDTPSSFPAKEVPWEIATNAGPFLPDELFPYGQKGKPYTYALNNRGGRVTKETRKQAKRAGMTLSGGTSWPVHDRRHALIAIRYMAAGRGDTSQYPRYIRKLAQLYSPEDSANRNIWSAFQKAQTAIQRHSTKPLPSMRVLRGSVVRRAAANTGRRAMRNSGRNSGRNQSYPYYVYNTATKQVMSGWEYREDAQEALREDQALGWKGLKVLTAKSVRNRAGRVRWAGHSETGHLR